MDAATFSALGPWAAVAAALVTGWFAMRTSRQQGQATPYEKLAERVTHLEEKTERQAEKIERLERRDARWGWWYDDLSFNWRIHRQRDYPPPRPDHDTFSPDHVGEE